MKEYRMFTKNRHIILLETIDNKKSSYMDLQALKVFNKLAKEELSGNFEFETSEDNLNKFVNKENFKIELEDFEKIMNVAKEIKAKDKKKKQFYLGEATATTVAAGTLLVAMLTTSKVNGMEAAAFEDLAEPIRLEQQDQTLEDNSIEETSTILANELKEAEPVQAVEDNYFVSSEIIEPKENNTIYVHTYPDYDEDLERNVSEYDNIIDAASNRWGVSNNLIRDIMKQESHGGTLDNKMQIVFSSWEDQIVKVYNYDTQRYETMVLTNEPPEKYPNVTYVISKDELSATAETNINAGAIIIAYLYNRFNHNLIQAIQAYNFGEGATKEVIEYTAKQLGMTVEEYNNSGPNDEFMKYTAVVRPGYGDPEYLHNAVRFDLEKGILYIMESLDENNEVHEEAFYIISAYAKENDIKATL